MDETLCALILYEKWQEKELLQHELLMIDKVKNLVVDSLCFVDYNVEMQWKTIDFSIEVCEKDAKFVYDCCVPSLPYLLVFHKLTDGSTPSQLLYSACLADSPSLVLSPQEFREEDVFQKALLAYESLEFHEALYL
jgi:hypothetical protein